MGTGKSSNTQVSIVNAEPHQNDEKKNAETLLRSESNVIHIGDFRQVTDKKQLSYENSKPEIETSRSNKHDDLIEENL